MQENGYPAPYGKKACQGLNTHNVIGRAHQDTGPTKKAVQTSTRKKKNQLTSRATIAAYAGWKPREAGFEDLP